jgi:hypothetical protein
MATPDPYWLDEHGRRLPKKPCLKCGANVGPMPLRVENLRHLGWEAYTVLGALHRRDRGGAVKLL